MIPEPPEINNWVIWGDLLESVMLDFKKVYDEDAKEWFIEIVHRPTKLMKFKHQIENKGKDYDRTRDAFISRFPLDIMGHIEPRTKGTCILMLCDWLGKETKILDKIDKNLLDTNKRLRTEIQSITSLLVREQTRGVQLAKHPEQFQKELIQQAREFKKITAPAVVGGVPVNPQNEEE